jgi:DNA invertase Pin-like site-specific DNA recombinase
MNKPQAVSYIRFSAAHQGKGSSVERQEALFEQWLREHPEYESSPLTRTDRGVSAFKGRHEEKGLGDVLKAIQGGSIQQGDCLVIEALDRLSRQEFDPTYQVIRQIVKAGVVIYTIEDGCCYDFSSINGTEIHSLAAKVHASNEYSKRLSQRLLGAYKSKRLKAESGFKVNAPNRPTWIDSCGNVILEKAQIAHRTIELYRAGSGQLDILRKLALEFPEHPDVPATTRSIKRILINEALIGYWRGVVAFDAIISVAEFVELQRLVANRTIPNKANETYLLSGLIRCGCCGGPYHFRTQKAAATLAAPLGSDAYQAKGLIVYANCSFFLKSNRCLNSLTVPYEVAELIFERNSAHTIESIAMGVALDSLNNQQLIDLNAEKALLEKKERTSKRIFIDSENEADFLRYQEFKNARIIVDAKLSKQQAITDRLEATKTPKIDFTYDDFLHGTEDQQSFHNAAQKAMDELCSNTINLRNELKAYGFKIEASRPKDKSSNGILICGDNEYRIKKRSQLLGCYIVSAKEVDADGGVIFSELQARRKPHK